MKILNCQLRKQAHEKHMIEVMKFNFKKGPSLKCSQRENSSLPALLHQ